MVEIQNTQEGIDLIRPGDDIRNVGYTSRRIDQKMQVRNTYLDGDRASSFDHIYNDQPMTVSNLEHKITGNYDFDDGGQGGINIPLDGTYIITCRVDTLLVEEHEAVYVGVVKNSGGAILDLAFISDRTYASYTLRGTEIVDLKKGDTLTVVITAMSLLVGTPLDYPKDFSTHISIVKLS